MDKKLICIAGPTASGKTALSVRLAKALDGEIVSCDSMQIYRHMDIGTAKPTVAEREGIPHYMLDVAEPGEDFSVGRYCEMADPIVADILARGKYAIVTGGTGLYMDALIRGNSFAPCPSTGVREKLEAQADEAGMEHMLSLLRQIDPDSAAKLHPADRKRILRALEVYHETGKTITRHNLETQQLPAKYTPIWLALEDEDRQALYRRIDRRVLTMLEQGLLDEIRQLLQMGIPESSTAMQAIGYKEYIQALKGLCSIDEATAQVQQASRHYAKRQLTWFRRNPKIHWLRRAENESSDEILLRARQILAEYDN